MDIQSEKEEQDFKKPKIKNSWIYLTVIFLLLVTNVVLFLQKKQTKEVVVQTQEKLVENNVQKDILQQEFNASLIRLDNLTSENSQLKDDLQLKNTELTAERERIKNILNKPDVSLKELEIAKGLIVELNNKISNYEVQLTQLKTENQVLKTQKDSVIVVNKGLNDKVELARIIQATNIRLVAIDIRRSGRKEVESTKARRIDLLRITFDIVNNRVIEDGIKKVQIRILNPNNELLSNAALGSSSFETESGELKYFSVSKEFYLKAGESLKNIDVDWKQNSDYEKGTYKVQIFYEGHLIGAGSVLLR